MLGSKIKTNLKVTVSLLGAGVLMVFFQNCSGDAGFAVDPSDSSKFETPLIIENGHQFTNKKIVEVQVILPGEEFTRMRVSKDEDFSKSPIEPYTTTFSYDLGDEWADDGSKDGPKAVFVELTPSIGPPTILNQTIGLDTVFPSIVPQGILATGLEGLVISEGSQQSLEWQGEDIPAPNGFSSGLDLEKGLKLGYTATEDCSASQVSLVQDWTGYTDGLSVTWPQKNPLDTFFFCIYAKDNAGNVKAVLSQPMSALWKVIVGENSQGNGGSFLAPNVRFKNPTILAMDAQSNLYISDSHFHNLRKANSPSSLSPGEMSLIMGDGHRISPQPGDSLKISLTGGINDIFFDEENNSAYFSGNSSGLFKIELDASRSRGNVTRIIRNQRLEMTTRMRQGVKSVLLYSLAGISEALIGTPESQAYLYEIPWEAFKSLAPESVMADLVPYRIAGNGTVPPSTYTVPPTANIGLDLNPTDLAQSVGWPGAVYSDPANGDIYLASRRDGNGRLWGHHTVRKLQQRDDGTFDQTLLSTSPWVNQIAKIDNRLLLARSTGFTELNIETLEETFPFPEHNGQSVLGVWVDQKTFPRTLYIAETYRSRVVAYDEFYQRKLTVGRPVYAETEPNALLAMVGQPDGVVETPDGRVIYVDSLNHAVRSVSKEGVIKTLIGGPDKGAHSAPVNANFGETTIDGRSASAIGYFMDLIGNFAGGQEILYMGTGAHRSVMALDLKQEMANQVVAPTLATVSELDGGSRTFALSGLALEPNSGSLFLSRSYHYGNNQPTHANFTGFIGKALVSGANSIVPESLFAGDLTQGRENFDSAAGNSVVPAPLNELVTFNSPSLRESKGILYSGNYGLGAMDLSSKTYRTLVIDGSSTSSIQQFEVFNEGTIDHIVFRVGEGLRAISVDQNDIKTGQAQIELTSKKLCLPGTFLNNSKNFSKGHKGNLIISDSWNGRILKYFVNSTEGIRFIECP